MHKLGRLIRFSINPFLPIDEEGFNPYSSKPCSRGLAVFFELGVGLAGEVEPSTGFVVNVLDIDQEVRRYVVPIFSSQIRQYYRHGKHVGFSELGRLLLMCHEKLIGKFGRSMLTDLSLKLNPFRKITIDCEDYKMIYISEKFEFAAMHKLWNNEFSAEKNFEVFGKCANPSGHGHNYIIEVTVKKELETTGFGMGNFEKTVNDEFIELVDHRNLNEDLPEFSKNIPSVENIAAFAWERMADKFKEAKLHSVTVWETDKTYCSYYG